MKQRLFAVFIGGLALTGLAVAQSGKVTLCHVPPDDPENFATITVGGKAADAHLAQHSLDQLGPCEGGGTPVSTVVLGGLMTTWAGFQLLRRRNSIRS